MKLSEQIKNLLTASAQSASSMFDYVSLFDKAVEEHRSTRTIPLTELRDIYRVRAQINRNNGSPIIGFDDLLHRMDAMTDEQVYISVFLAPAGRFIFFTDMSIEKLVGILFKPANELQHEQTMQERLSSTERII